jgi:hypothetical protein
LASIDYRTGPALFDHRCTVILVINGTQVSAWYDNEAANRTVELARMVGLAD